VAETSNSPSPIRAPSPLLLALEMRVFAELPRFALKTWSLHVLPRGNGLPLIVLPGFLAGDLATLPLRRALQRLGHAAYGWGQGVNLGMRPQLKQRLAQRLLKLHARHQAPVALIGWSLGGVFAREMARHHAHAVRHVFTLGSPIGGDPQANHMRTLFRLVNRGQTAQPDPEGFLRRQTPPPVPCTAIYSKSDGIVAWRCCLERPAPNTENVEVRGTHFGLIVNDQVLRILAERLAGV
jgi:pimeloyl-ACP methyl ester carboxylesterase